MPRAPRLQDAGLLHHVITRGNDRQILFRSPQDFQKYLELLSHARREFPLKIYNYVLMDNHIHLLVEPTEEGNLSKAMEYVSKGYAKYFNKTYQHVGHVFQGRFKSFLVQDDRYFFTCSRYIDLNPVKANLVSNPADYLWSGHKTLAAGYESAFKIDHHHLYTALGKNDKERQIAYRALIQTNLGEELDLLDRRVCILGDDEFKKKIRKK